MKLHIPFKSSIYKEQLLLYLDQHWAKTLKQNNNNRFIYSFLAVFGILILYGKSDAGFLFIFISLIGFFNYYRVRNLYKKAQKQILETVQKESEAQMLYNEPTILECNEEYMIYKNYKFDIKLRWFAFKTYRVIDGHLFIDLDQPTNASYIFSKDEMKTEEFDQLIAFIDRKLISNHAFVKING